MTRSDPTRKKRCNTEFSPQKSKQLGALSIGARNGERI